MYLARGHLAPNADFLTYAWQVEQHLPLPTPACQHLHTALSSAFSGQDATFTFIDVAPQWQSFNAGNWLDLENGVRDLAAKVIRDSKVQDKGLLAPDW